MEFLKIPCAAGIPENSMTGCLQVAACLMVV